MTQWTLRAFALSIATLFALQQAQAQTDDYFAEESIPHWGVESEILFLRLNSAHGASQDNIFGFDPAMRHALSYTTNSGLGIRGTYFDYDHQATFAAPGGTRLLSLDINNTDVEMFKRLTLTDTMTIEVSGGMRYSDNEVFFPTRFEPNHFTGIGGVLGFRAQAHVGTSGAFYAKGKMAFLTGNGRHDGNGINTPIRFDESRTHTEIGLGYQHTFTFGKFLVTPYADCQWMNLSDYQVDTVDEHPEADLMLAGFGVGLNISF